MAGPLEGLVVLDMTRVLAGPFCTMLLADMGAEVIKVERPKTGDDSRAFGPFVGGESAYFMSINRGKKSVTLDLKHPEGKALLRSLVQKADVLVENFKPGVLAKLGFSHEALRALNPRLIYAASSGFGHSGPYSERPAYDLIIQGMGGMMSITGPDATQPTKVGSSIADIFAGVFCAIGILAALHRRQVSGEGQMVDVAMLDCMVAILENAISRYVAAGESPVPIGNRHPSIAPFATVKTADGLINIACGNDELWRRFCAVAGLEALVADARFATNPARVEHWEALEPLINAATVSRTSQAWLTALQGAGVPSGPLNDVQAVMVDPQVLARKMLVEVIHPVAGKMLVPGVPIKFSEMDDGVLRPAPLLGQDNAAIYGGLLGLSDEALAALQAQGVM